MKHAGIKRTLLAACLLSASASAFAAVITFSDVTIIRETRSPGNPPPGFNTGDRLLLDLVATPAPGTTVTATNSSSSDIFNLTQFGSSFSSDFFTYTEDLANGGWIFTAENGGDTTTSGSFVFGTGDGTGPMPGVTNVTVSGPSTTPTLVWDLLDLSVDNNDGYVNRLRTRVQDESGSTIFDSRSDLGLNLDLDLTTYVIPAGFITEPGVYYASVIVEGFGPKELGEPGDGFDPDVAFTQLVRSRTFAEEGFEVSPIPIPAAVWLFGTALIGLVGFGKRRKAA